MTDWIGGGVDTAKAGVIAKLMGEPQAGKLVGQPDETIMPTDEFSGQERMEYLIAAHNVRGSGSNINPTVPTRRWIYGRPRKGAIPKHKKAGDAVQPQLERLMEHYVSKTTGEYGGSGSAMQPINRLWGAFWRRFEAYMSNEAPSEMAQIMSQLDPLSEGGYTSEGMQVVLDRLDQGGSILGDSYQEIAADLGRANAHTTNLQNRAHTQLGGAQRFDQVWRAGVSFPTLSGEDIEIKEIADIEEGNWFAEKVHHSIGPAGARKGASGYDLSDPEDIRGHYNDNRIPLFNRIMSMVRDFARQAAGDAPLDPQSGGVSTGETSNAWYRRQAVFYGTQINKIGRGTGGSEMVGSKAGQFGFSSPSSGTRPSVPSNTAVFYDSQTQRLETFGLNPYAQTERGNMRALQQVLNEAIADGIYSEWFGQNESVSYADLVFVLHHMGSVNALYDDLLTSNPNLIVREYSELMLYDNGGGEWTLVINFGMDNDGFFNELGEGDVAIIPMSLEQIYMEAVNTSSQLENDNALDAAALSVFMSRMRGWLIPETAKARIIHGSHRFTCKADAAIPGQMSALAEAFMMMGDNAAATYINQLQSDMRGVSVSFSSLLRGSVLGQLRGRWPSYAWGSGAGRSTSRNPDLLHSPSTHPPALYVGQRADAGVKFYPQEGDPYFETRSEWRERTGSTGQTSLGWPGDFLKSELEVRTTSGEVDPLERQPFYKGAYDKAQDKSFGYEKIQSKAFGMRMLRQQMEATYGHTDWLAAMTEGVNVFGTQPGDQEALSILAQHGTGTGSISKYGHLAGIPQPPSPWGTGHVAEASGLSRVAGGAHGASVPWIPNTKHNRQIQALTSSDLGFLWALPYATWGYAQLGGSR